MRNARKRIAKKQIAKPEPTQEEALDVIGQLITATLNEFTEFNLITRIRFAIVIIRGKKIKGVQRVKK
jgi:hypothetical protein